MNRFNYINDIAMKNTSGSEHNASSLQFSLQATVGHHGNYMHRSHYTTSVNHSGKTFYDTRIAEWDVRNTHNSSTVCIVLLYKLITEWPSPNREEWGFIKCHGAGTFVCPIEYRSRHKLENLWGGRWVSSWWSLVWFDYWTSKILVNYILSSVCLR